MGSWTEPHGAGGVASEGDGQRQPTSTPFHHVRVRHDRTPSLEKLGGEILLLILRWVHEVSPTTTGSVALANSYFRRMARYVQHREVTIRLKGGGVTLSERLELMENNELFRAVRRLRIAGIGPGRNMITLFCENLCKMRGLRDLEWLDNGVPREVIASLRSSPSVRLHTIVWDGPSSQRRELDQILRLQDCPNLHSLRVSRTYRNSKGCLNVARPLRCVLLSCPNLRVLGIDISRPRIGCVVDRRPSEYCGFGLTDGARPPALEELELDNYPFGYTSAIHDDFPFGNRGYPLPGSELDYWADQFDWTRLKRLSTSAIGLALSLMPRLAALEEVSFYNIWDRSRARAFFRDVPVALECITIPNLVSVRISDMLRHGSRLRRLQIHQEEICGGGWRDAATSVECLRRIRDGFPHIEELSVDIRRESGWPYEALEVLSGFPKLRTLRIWFELGLECEKGPTRPYVTYSAVSELFRYLCEHRPEGLPRFQQLQITVGSPPAIGRGLPASGASWPEDNSLVFTCSPTGQSSKTGQDACITRCTRLSDEANEVLRVDGDAARFADDKTFRVARDGPVPMPRWIHVEGDDDDL